MPCIYTFAVSFFCYTLGADPLLPSFPTRRSSDLPGPAVREAGGAPEGGAEPQPSAPLPGDVRAAEPGLRGARLLGRGVRSEEHTSELQSPCNLVCRLLLEKKNRICATKDR